MMKKSSHHQQQQHHHHVRADISKCLAVNYMVVLLVVLVLPIAPAFGLAVQFEVHRKPWMLIWLARDSHFGSVAVACMHH